MRRSIFNVVCLLLVAVLVAHGLCAGRCTAAGAAAAATATEPPCHKTAGSESPDSDSKGAHHDADGCKQALGVSAKDSIQKLVPDAVFDEPYCVSPLLSGIETFAPTIFIPIGSPPALRSILRI
jgi:hypothetical protein